MNTGILIYVREVAKWCEVVAMHYMKYLLFKFSHFECISELGVISYFFLHCTYISKIVPSLKTEKKVAHFL